MSVLRVTLFGSSGLMGTDLLRRAPSSVQFLPHRSDVDLTNKDAVWKALQEDKPDWIINAAAYNNVDKAETETDRAFAVNAEGPGHLAEMASRLNVPLVQGSTDYVFSGSKSDFYLETDKPDPISVYGKSKAAGETRAAAWEKHYVLRLSALYGTARANHADRILAAIRGGEPTTLITDLFASPTYTGDLAYAVFALLEKKPAFGIYHLCNAGSCSRYDFGVEMCRRAGLKEPFPIKTARLSEFGFAAKRPPKVRLSFDKWQKSVGPLPSWQEGVGRYLSEKGIRGTSAPARS